MRTAMEAREKTKEWVEKEKKIEIQPFLNFMDGVVFNAVVRGEWFVEIDINDIPNVNVLHDYHLTALKKLGYIVSIQKYNREGIEGAILRVCWDWKW